MGGYVVVASTSESHLDLIVASSIHSPIRSMAVYSLVQ